MLDPNLVTIQDYCYHQGSVLGHGTYAAVYRGYKIGSEVPVAVKVIPIQNLNAETLRNLEQELMVLQLLPAHENIVKVHAVYRTGLHVYVVTELCEGRLNSVRSEDYESVVVGIGNGLRHLRNYNIVHRDLKTDNIVMKGSTPKIIDFGFARILAHPEERLLEYLGTPLYMSPQVQQNSVYTSKCDIWSFGVIMYEMLFKRHPWYNPDRQTLLLAVRTQPLTFPYNSPSQQIMRLIERCLVYDEQHRIGWNELFQITDSLKGARRPLQAVSYQPSSYTNTGSFNAVSSYNKMTSMRQNAFSRSPSRERNNGRRQVTSVERAMHLKQAAIQKPQTPMKPQTPLKPGTAVKPQTPVKPHTAVPSRRGNNENAYVPRDVRMHFVNYYM